MSLTRRRGRAGAQYADRRRAGRPATNRHDVEVQLAETAPGHYEARRRARRRQLARLAGSSEQHEAADPIYRTRRRIWLTP